MWRRETLELVYGNFADLPVIGVAGLDDFVERVQDVEVQEREEAILQVEVTSEKATITWHKVGPRSDKSTKPRVTSMGYCLVFILPCTGLIFPLSCRMVRRLLNSTSASLWSPRARSASWC